jgi:ribosomal protein S6--L-glutamate ligase
MSKKIGVIGLQGGWSSERLLETVEAKTGYGRLIEMNHVAFDLSKGTVTHDDIDLMSLDALMVKKIGSKYSPDLMERMEILRFLQIQGQKIFSRPDIMFKAMDRLSCTAVLRHGGIPIPPTVITEDHKEAEKAIARFGRAVLKPIYTSKARGMILVDSGNDVKHKLEQFNDSGNKIIYIQKIVDLPGRDLGVVFLGGKYVATYARVKNGDSWNTTIRAGGKYEPYEPGENTLKLAQQAQDLFGLDFTSVDIAETPDGPVVFEVSAFGGFRGLQMAHDIDAAELYVDYVLEKLK